MNEFRIILMCLILIFTSQLSRACTVITSFCYEATFVNSERIVVGTITNSSPNSVDLNIIQVLYGTENSSTITIWDGSTIECNGYWPNYANDMGSIGDTVLCLIEPITSVENTWEVIGDYRRPSLLAGYALYTNFSSGNLFENTYNFNDVLTLNIANYCCNDISNFIVVNFTGLPSTTGSTAPINLTGYPAGGTFSGPGVAFNAFNPSLAGPGQHAVTYTYNDEFGCSFTAEDEIFVFTIDFNFVSYNLGTIAPKLTNEINIELEVQEPEEYFFRVFDLSGKMVYNEKEQFIKGTHLKNITVNDALAKGLYILNVSNGKADVTKRFVMGR